MAYTSKNPRFNSQTLTDQGAAAVSNPQSGSDKIVNRNGQLYLRSSAGTETPIGAGAGGINYLSKISDGTSAPGTVSTVAAGGNVTVSGSFPNVTSAWYADATSGAAAIASSSDNTLRGTSNYLTALSGASTSGATFVQTPVFNIDGEDLGKALSIKFDVSGVTTDDDWDVVMVRYNSSGVFQELISVAGNVSTVSSTPSAKLPLATTSFRGFFITGATASDIYAMRWRRRNGSDDIRLDTLVIGPDAVMEGAIFTDWEDYTPTITGGASFTIEYSKYKRIGDTVFIAGTALAVNPAASPLTISLPSNLTRFVTPAGGTVLMGSYTTDYSGATQAGIFPVLASNTTIGFGLNNLRNGFAAINGNLTLVNNSRFSWTAAIHVSEWSSNTVMASRAVEEYAYNTDTSSSNNTSAFGYGPQGTSIAYTFSASSDKTVRFQTPILPTDKLFFEIDLDGTGRWVELPLGGQGLSYVGGQAIGTYSALSSVGLWWFTSNTTNTDCIVRFGRYRNATANWSDFTNGRWRVRKVSGGAAVGFPIGVENLVGGVAVTNDAQTFSGEKTFANALISEGSISTYKGSVGFSTTPTTIIDLSTVNDGSYLFVIRRGSEASPVSIAVVSKVASSGTYSVFDLGGTGFILSISGSNLQGARTSGSSITFKYSMLRLTDS